MSRDDQDAIAITVETTEPKQSGKGRTAFDFSTVGINNVSYIYIYIYIYNIAIHTHTQTHTT